MIKYCKICNKPDCKEHNFILPKINFIKDFSGSSPPEIFIGSHNYPNVNIGILSPTIHGNTKIMSSAEEWHKNNLGISQIIGLRDRLIYGRMKSHIKERKNEFLSVMKEVAMTHKSISAEFSLKKPVSVNLEKDEKTPIIMNSAIIKKAKLQENASVLPKIDYLVNDTEVKSKVALEELNKAGIETSSIIKILSAGLLGKRTARKLVPTKWAITAVDSILSQEKLAKIKFYSEIPDILLFHSEYLGNHYEFLLLPDKFSFEVIERSLSNKGMWKDYEGFNGRKSYAFSVTGAYYANRLALTEYLEKIKKQASCLVIREVKPFYNVPLGVGILRETSRQAFSQQPEKAENLSQAFAKIQSRLEQPLTEYTSNSKLLSEYKKQSRLTNWF